MMRFKEKTAFITGAGGPMGAAIAKRLASEGADLFLSDISERRLAANADALRSEFEDRKIVAYRASVLEESELPDLLAKCSSEFASIDILINVVGGVRGGLGQNLENMTAERWYNTFDFNLKGTVALVKAFAPGMVERGYGRIVNFSSMSYAGDETMPDYGAAKAAVASLTRSIAIEFAPHVTANCVAPSLIETTAVDRVDPEFIADLIRRTPLKRLGKPEDVAGVVAFLASDDAAFITGTVMPITGGHWISL